MIADFLFFLFAAGAVLGAALMVTRRNPVASVIYLIVVFFSLSGMYLLQDAHFIAALQVTLYAGAIMVLFLFVIMLLNLGDLSGAEVRGPVARFLAGSVSLALLATVTRFLVGGGPMMTRRETGAALEEALRARGVVGAVATPLFREYAVAFEVTGLLLLVAMVGAIVLARRRAP